MSLLWIEGFESFGANSGDTVSDGLLDAKYPSLGYDTGGPRMRDGRVTGRSLSYINGVGSTFFITTPSLGNMSTVITGLGFKAGVASIAAFPFLELREENNATQGVNLRVTSGGRLDLYLGSFTLIASSAEGVIQLNTWHFVEMKIAVANSGTYEVRVDGVTVISGSGDTQAGSSANANMVRLVSPGPGSNVGYYFDDWYVCDGSGSVNDDFLGDKVVFTIFPNAAGDSTDFTPSTGNNFENVDETPADGDSTYVESDTGGDRDLYNFGSAPFDTIDGIQVNAVVKKTDSTDFGLRLTTKSSGTVSQGGAQTVNHTGYKNHYRVMENDPHTSSAWTSSGVNAAQFGVEVDS